MVAVAYILLCALFVDTPVLKVFGNSPDGNSKKVKGLREHVNKMC